jgi:hypothetical protein
MNELEETNGPLEARLHVAEGAYPESVPSASDGNALANPASSIAIG